MPVISEPPRPTAPHAGSSPARIGRLGIGFNVFLQLLIVGALVLAANWIAFRHHQRFDFSRDRKFALSERTRQFLGGLSKPVHLTVFMDARATMREDAVSLLNEYKQTQPKFVVMEAVNPYAEPARATELATKYKLGQADDNVIIVECEGRQKLLPQEALADVDRSGEQFGQAATVTAFKGEQAVTGALLEVVEAKKNLVYYLRGQNQPELGPGGPITQFQQSLERENVQLKDLNLANSPGIPADASAVFLAGARYDLSEPEIKALDDYWGKQGRLIIVLNPEAPTPRLAKFLAERAGIRPDDNRITYLRVLGTTPDGAQIVQRAPVTIGESASEASPVTRSLKGVNFTVPGATQSLTLEPERVKAGNVKLEGLVRAAEGFWGEVDYAGTADGNPESARFDAGRDKKDNLFFAASAERGAVADNRVSVPSARLVVIANSRFLEDGMTSQDMADFFRNSLNWLLDRERLIGIPPREVRTFTTSVPEAKLNQLFAVTTLLIPALLAFVGAFVWWRRRV